MSSTLPHPASTLSIERGETRPDVGADPAVLTGVVTRRFDVTLRGQGWVFGVKFRPGGLTALTGIAARALRDRTVPAADQLPEAVLDPLRGLGPSCTTDECAAAGDAALGNLPQPADPVTSKCSRW